jgi:hypothetical protein
MDGDCLSQEIIDSTMPLCCDALWLLGLELESMSADQSLRYHRSIEFLLRRSILTREQLFVHLDDAVLLSCSLISSADQFKKRQNIVRTKFM